MATELKIGENNPCFIVAEAGVAHGGDFQRALELVDTAAQAGADAVKFQVYKSEEYIDRHKDPEQFERMKKKELPYETFEVLNIYAKANGLIFFATPHCLSALEFLDKLGVPCFKIGSGEVGNFAFIEKVARKGKPVLLSTGMYDVETLEQTVKLFDLNKLILLHCVTEYPVPPENVNLRAIETLKQYGTVVGYSDHTADMLFPVVAVGLGAKVIEKHICLTESTPGNDAKVSLDVVSFACMVAYIRVLEKGIGDGKLVGPSQENVWARKDPLTGKRPYEENLLSTDYQRQLCQDKINH